MLASGQSLNHCKWLNAPRRRSAGVWIQGRWMRSLHTPHRCASKCFPPYLENTRNRHGQLSNGRLWHCDFDWERWGVCLVCVCVCIGGSEWEWGVMYPQVIKILPLYDWKMKLLLLSTHIWAPAQWCDQKRTMTWCQGWRRPAQHKPSGHCGRWMTQSSQMWHYTKTILAVDLWPWDWKQGFLAYKKRDESGRFVLLYHLFQRLSPDSEILVSGNLLHCDSSNQTSTFHGGMRLWDREQKRKTLLEKEDTAMHERELVPARLSSTAQLTKIFACVRHDQQVMWMF